MLVLLLYPKVCADMVSQFMRMMFNGDLVGMSLTTMFFKSFATQLALDTFPLSTLACLVKAGRELEHGMEAHNLFGMTLLIYMVLPIWCGMMS